jgi:hypothetical protein
MSQLLSSIMHSTGTVLGNTLRPNSGSGKKKEISGIKDKCCDMNPGSQF